jgi:hypothetical protein
MLFPHYGLFSSIYQALEGRDVINFFLKMQKNLSTIFLAMGWQWEECELP